MGKRTVLLTESDLKEMVLHRVRSLMGEDPVFPADRFRRFKSKKDRVLESALLDEGLIRTYPFDWVYRYLQRNANTDFLHVFATEKEKKFQVTLKRGSKSIEPLKRTMDMFGYHCGYEGNDHWFGGYLMQFEPKFDEYVKGSEFTFPKGKYAFYHVAPYRFKDKILSQGLVPLHKNNMFTYPDRVYLISGNESLDASYEMARMLRSADKNNRNNGMYALFGVTLDGLDDVKFYKDWNIDHADAYYTHENIPPRNVSFLEVFNVDRQ